MLSVSTGEKEGAVVVSGRGSCSVLLASASAPSVSFWTFLTCTLGWKNAYSDRYTHTHSSISLV